MTDLKPVSGSGGLYAVPADAGWLAILLNKPLASRATLFVALNETCASLSDDADGQAKASLSALLGLPAPDVWHQNTHPLRSREAARAACAALIAGGYQP